jgi:hypothetical protein
LHFLDRVWAEGDDATLTGFRTANNNFGSNLFGRARKRHYAALKIDPAPGERRRFAAPASRAERK